ncbi:MAG: hypothetical protein Q9163_001484 [Psora crenata]
MPSIGPPEAKLTYISNVATVPDASQITKANGSSKLGFDSIEDTIEAFKEGQFIIVLDSPSRENEGDLIIAAEDITEEKVAFMVRHTSGLICAPLAPSLTSSLLLPQMVLNNTEVDGTAYTISVDSADAAMTTGISAHDRALTCRKLASATNVAADFRRPGHVFPLKSRPGGVRERSGHTEATIEFCRPIDAIRVLEEDGGVILTDFCSVVDVHKVNEDAAPYLNAKVEECASRGVPRDTVRCHRLFGRSTTVREKWLQQPNLWTILRHFLRTVSIPYNDQGETKIETDPILSAAATLDIGPGVKAQDLHRDDFIWQQTHNDGNQKTYRVGHDVSLGLLVPGVDTSPENGATMFVPGSHLWDHSRRTSPEEAVPAAMSVGEAFIFLGSAAHGGGTNTTEQSRSVHGFFYCRSYLRPEENQFLWWRKDEIESWSVAAQKQSGYILDNPFLGHCDETNPLDLFRASL